MALRVKILDTAAGAAMFKELGLLEAADSLIAGDVIAAFNIFFNNISAILMDKGIHNVLRIIFKYAIIKTAINAIPGTGKTFNVLGLVEIEI